MNKYPLATAKCNKCVDLHMFIILPQIKQRKKIVTRVFGWNSIDMNLAFALSPHFISVLVNEPVLVQVSLVLLFFPISA